MASPMRCALVALISWLAVTHAVAADAPHADGRTLYLEGRHADGAPLMAARAGGLALAGRKAACVNCHRRSGLGGSEGRSSIPAIGGASLLAAMPAGKGASATGRGRPAYTEAALARALRAGVDPGGRPLDFLMPRYQLADAEVRSLLEYLRRLPQAPEASETADRRDAAPLEFATIVAPDASPEQAQAMVDVLQACFAEHNAGPAPEHGRKRMASGMRARAARPWRLHVWPLEGAPATWSSQLESRVGTQPVFATVGGIGAGEWSPVHAFCEREGLPCLFPHVEAPVADAGAFYPLYLGRGVLLEAGLIARQLANAPVAPRRVVQVLREGDASARAGAQALERALARQGLRAPLSRVLHDALDAAALSDIGAEDALVLWLRPGELRRLQDVAPAQGQVFLSATLADNDAVALPIAWKTRALLAYPYELPQNRGQGMAALRRWLHARGIAPGDERVQADAYVACMSLRNAMDEVDEHLGRDYLVERLEADMERSSLTGLYPRLALGIGQRFAAKAGYLVRFAGDDPARLVPVGERSAP